MSHEKIQQMQARIEAIKHQQRELKAELKALEFNFAQEMRIAELEAQLAELQAQSGAGSAKQAATPASEKKQPVSVMDALANGSTTDADSKKSANAQAAKK